MNRIQIDKDIQPLSEFRSNVAFYFNQVKKTKRPLIITQHGKSAAVVLDVSQYEAMIEKIELLEDIKLAEQQVNEGKVAYHSDVKKRFAKRSKK